MSKRKLSEAQILLRDHILPELGVEEEILTEFGFADGRDWRLDVYVPDLRLAIEVHGGQFTGGHRRGYWSAQEARRRKIAGKVDSPQEDEYNKLNSALMDGYRVLQFSNEQVKDGRAKAFLAGVL